MEVDRKFCLPDQHQIMISRSAFDISMCFRIYLAVLDVKVYDFVLCVCSYISQFQLFVLAKKFQINRRVARFER